MAPRRFVLEVDYDRSALLAFIAKIRRIVCVEKRNVVVDFRKTLRMHPCGTLLFVAELERIRRSRGGDSSCFRCIYPKDLVVEQVLQQVGILDILRCKARQPEQNFEENVRHWRFASGLQVEGAKLEELSAAFEGKIADALMTDFYDGITEAMTNSIQHAYELERNDGITTIDDLKRWWMFSQEYEGFLYVAFCDTGIGIPRSLKSDTHWSREILGDLMRSLKISGDSESELIKGAIELRTTRTEEQHRGRGLSEILDVVRNSGKGTFLIHSNRGSYKYDASDESQRLTDFNESIRGTLILWKVPLAELREPHDPQS